MLVDEFDNLLGHPQFNDAKFFGALRSLATRYAGLALVTASRLSVAEMNCRSTEQKQGRAHVLEAVDVFYR